jgi:hypothetical protein
VAGITAAAMSDMAQKIFFMKRISIFIGVERLHFRPSRAGSNLMKPG